MNQFYTADYIFPITGEPIRNGVVEVQQDGVIAGLWQPDNCPISPDKIKYLNGMIVPGFVNAHCHLELSHLLGKITPGNGLVEFIKDIGTKRGKAQEDTLEAMKEADKQMFKNGIVAVGDHANTTVSNVVKNQSQLYYHTFLELIAFEPDRAEEVFESSAQLMNEFGTLKVTPTPHAPYSVSKDLFKLVKANAENNAFPVSIHNQESAEENKFFRYKSGGFIDFYAWLGKNIDFFKAQSRTSLQTISPLLPINQKIQLVHNTFTSVKDVDFVKRIGKDIYWCLCLKANLYIENNLPKIQSLLHEDHPITIGTDSLASNDKLCILSELITLANAFPEIELSEMLKWATLNGATFLGIESKYGSIEIGKSPGLNLIKNTKGLTLTPESQVEKIS